MTKDMLVDNKEHLSDLQQWFKSEQGIELLDAQRRSINRLLPNLFGYFLVEIAINTDMQLSSESLVVNKVTVAANHQLGLPDKTVLCDTTELPFEHNSIDVIILHHSLDFTSSPHQVLREAYRVLRPGGHLILIGFNLASWWGVTKICKRKIKAPWQRANFLSQGRLTDWMRLLGLTPVRSLSDYYLPPFVSLKWRKRFQKVQAYGRRSMPKNGAYTVNLARKDIKGMTPITKLKPVNKFYKLQVQKPATREQTRERS